MDLDCLVHRQTRPDGNNRFLAVESKNLGKAVPGAQMMTLHALHDIRPACFTVMIVWEKHRPIWGEWWSQGSLEKQQWCREAEAQYRVEQWFRQVNTGEI